MISHRRRTQSVKNVVNPKPMQVGVEARPRHGEKMTTKSIFLDVWRESIASLNGPTSPTTRHILLTLSLGMGPRRGVCTTQIGAIASMTGLSRSTIIPRLNDSVEERWLIKTPVRRSGQRGRRYVYVAHLPDEVARQVDKKVVQTIFSVVRSNTREMDNIVEGVRIYGHYISRIYPPRKNKSRAIENISLHLRRFSAGDLVQAVNNYGFATAKAAPYLKLDPADFFEVSGQWKNYVVDYLNWD